MTNYPSIFNDVIGPVMRGPSSSHCAASLRIARICRDLMEEQIKNIVITFDPNGSLATTHKSQGSDMGLFGGFLGWEAYDERLPLSENHLEPNGIFVHIEIKDITVQFSPKLEPAVNQLSITIQPGETIALVGASGSGKTTLVNLLPRFIEANSGVIQLDGVDIKDWNLDNLRQQFAMVSQHVYMLNASLAHNVALGQNLDQDKVWECLKAANLEDFVSELPLGIHTLVGHNANQLSGGQRQRLAIARALYKNAPILILDEATSALDTQSERAVQSALTVLMKNRTSLVIAHRLSTVEHADRIVVMEASLLLGFGPRMPQAVRRLHNQFNLLTTMSTAT